MDRLFTPDGIEDAVDGLGGQGAVGRSSRDVGFVNLHAGTFELRDLGGERVRQSQGQLLQAGVMIIQKSSGQHVRARERELERATGDPRCTGAIGR